MVKIFISSYIYRCKLSFLKLKFDIGFKVNLSENTIIYTAMSKAFSCFVCFFCLFFFFLFFCCFFLNILFSSLLFYKIKLINFGIFYKICNKT